MLYYLTKENVDSMGPENICSCLVDSASRYLRVMKTNLMRYLSSAYFVNYPLHVSAIFVAHHQEVYCIYTVYKYGRNM